MRFPLLALTLSLATAAAAFDPASGDYGKADPADVRVLSYNTERNFIAEPATDDAFARVLQSIQPDIIVMQEVVDGIQDVEFQTRLNSLLPNGDGSSWSVHFGEFGGIYNVVMARWPLTMRRTDTIPESDTRGVTLALVDLPDSIYAQDLYLGGVHLKCCNSDGTEQARRQRAADAIASWFGDARTSGGFLDLPANTPMVTLGDFNLVGGPSSFSPATTLVTGDIQDETTFGPDIKGDWDGSDLTDLMPADPFTGDTDTWRSSSSNPTSRLDRFFYTDSAVEIPTSFVFNTLTMPNSVLQALGLNFDDTTPDRTADHLPLVADFRFAGAAGAFLSLDAQVYNCEGSVQITLIDSALSGAGSAAVIAQTSPANSVQLPLAETSPGRFMGTLELTGAAPQGPQLQVADSDILTISYSNEGGAEPVETTATAGIDCAPPAISNVQVAEAGKNFFTVTFDTSETATPNLQFGTVCPLFQGNVGSPDSGTAHSLTVSGLEPATTYHFFVRATDLAGNLATGTDGGDCFEATTTSGPAIVINEVSANNPSQVELANRTGQPVDVGNWVLRMWDLNDNEEPSYTLPAGTTIPADGFLTITERDFATGPGQLETGFFIDWFPAFPGAALLQDDEGATVDFMRWGGSNVTPADASAWSGASVAMLPSYSVGRVAGAADTDGPADWQPQARTFGSANAPLPGSTGYFERFTPDDPFDLAFHQITFTPDEEAERGFTYTIEPITALPEPVGSETFEFSGGDSWDFRRFLSADGSFLFPFGADINREIFVATNGYLTFDDGDQDSTESPEDHFRLRRVSALFDDLEPGSPSRVHLAVDSQRAAITWQAVAEAGQSNANTFQIVLHADGEVVIAFLDIAVQDGIVGISSGGFVSGDEARLEVDFLTQEPTAQNAGWTVY
ncbi:MAG: lamin tail domain-containing protein [Sumerlaeia bacterium]